MSSVTLRANAAAMLAAKLLPPAFAFAVHLGIARLSGPETLGAYVNLLAVLMIFQAMANAGMQFLVVREIAAFPERAAEHAQRARAFGLASGIAATVVYVLYAITVVPQPRLAPALALALTVLPTAWIALHDAIFMATRTHYGIAVVAIVENTIKLGVAMVALMTGHGLLAVCIGIAVARLAGLAVGGWLVRRLGVVGTWRIVLADIAPFARAVAPFSTLFILSMAYFRIDVPIVRLIAGERMTGFYAAAVALYGALLLLPESALSAAYPRLARSFQSSKDGYVRATWLVAKVLAVGIVPLSVVLIATAEPIIRLAYGETYLPAVAVLRLLALSLPIHALNGALGQALQAGGEQQAMVGVVTAAFLAHVILNLALVPWLGIPGAALAMLLSSSCAALGALRVIHLRVARIQLTPRMIAPATALVGPLIVVTFAPSGYELVAGFIGLTWLLLGALASSLFAPAEIHGIRAALGGVREVSA